MKIMAAILLVEVGVLCSIGLGLLTGKLLILFSSLERNYKEKKK